METSKTTSHGISQLDLWMSSSAAPPVRHSQLPVSEREWLIHVATYPLSTSALLQSCAQSGWCTRTSQDCCPQGEDKIFRPSSQRWLNSGMGSPTELLTLQTSDSPSVGKECSSLAAVLVTGDIPQRYYLTAQAASGILRRARKREKVLPPLLEQALEAQAASSCHSEQEEIQT